MRGMCLGPSAVCINFSLAVVIKPAWCSGLFISSYLSLQLWLRLPASAGRTSGIGLAEPWWREGRYSAPTKSRQVSLAVCNNFDKSGLGRGGKPF